MTVINEKNKKNIKKIQENLNEKLDNNSMIHDSSVVSDINNEKVVHTVEAKENFALFKSLFSMLKVFYKDIKIFLSAPTPEEAGYGVKVEQNLKEQIKPAIKAGFYIIGGAASIFIIWGVIAPLDSASIAPGSIIPSGKVKAIQHLEGGIIKEILVKEGDRVKEGQNLIIFDSSKAKADRGASLSHLRTELVEECRFIAESLGESEIDFNHPIIIEKPEILDLSNPEVQTLMKTQKDLFEARSMAEKQTLNTYDKKIQSTLNEIEAKKALLKSYKEQSQIMKKQYQNLKSLAEKGLATQITMAEYQKNYEHLEGVVGATISEINSLTENIASLEADRSKHIEAYKAVFRFKRIFKA